MGWPVERLSREGVGARANRLESLLEAG